MRMTSDATSKASRSKRPEPAEEWVRRQAAIRDLVARNVIESQTELVERLEKMGFEVTQSSVSRDLAEMRVAKIDGRYVTVESLAPQKTGATERELRGAGVFIRSHIVAGPNLLVVKTATGTANAVAVAIDQAEWPEVAGTVAGDDTLLVVTRKKSDQMKVVNRLIEISRT
jgi:transcriptional regulator of arginine metabolism